MKDGIGRKSEPDGAIAAQSKHGREETEERLCKRLNKSTGQQTIKKKIGQHLKKVKLVKRPAEDAGETHGAAILRKGYRSLEKPRNKKDWRRKRPKVIITSKPDEGSYVGIPSRKKADPELIDFGCIILKAKKLKDVIADKFFSQIKKYLAQGTNITATRSEMT